MNCLVLTLKIRIFAIYLFSLIVNASTLYFFIKQEKEKKQTYENKDLCCSLVFVINILPCQGFSICCFF